MATARLRRADDVLEPTGDLVVGLALEIDSSCATFVGPTVGVTGADGTFTTQLVSDTPCLAVVHAFNAADAVQSAPCYVNFDARLSFWINGSPAPISGPGLHGAVSVSCAQIRFTLRDYLMSEPISGLEGGYWAVYVPENAWVGDAVGVSFTRWAGNSLCDEDASHSYGPVWVHTAYQPDFAHQRAYQLTGGGSVSGTVSFGVTFEEIDYYAGGLARTKRASVEATPVFTQRIGDGPASVMAGPRGARAE